MKSRKGYTAGELGVVLFLALGVSLGLYFGYKRYFVGNSAEARMADAAERQAKAQEQMVQELNQIKQILGSWEWEKPDGR